MSYHRRSLKEQIVVQPEDYDLIEKYKNTNPTDFDKLTLDYVWKEYSEKRDSNNNFIEPQVVPELRYLFVPRVLFESLGVYTWFRHSFPNCVIMFWENSYDIV